MVAVGIQALGLKGNAKTSNTDETSAALPKMENIGSL